MKLLFYRLQPGQFVKIFPTVFVFLGGLILVCGKFPFWGVAVKKRIVVIVALIPLGVGHLFFIKFSGHQIEKIIDQLIDVFRVVVFNGGVETLFAIDMLVIV